MKTVEETKKYIRGECIKIAFTAFVCSVLLAIFYNPVEVARQAVGLFLFGYPLSAVVTLGKVVWDLKGEKIKKLWQRKKGST